MRSTHASAVESGCTKSRTGRPMISSGCDGAQELRTPAVFANTTMPSLWMAMASGDSSTRRAVALLALAQRLLRPLLLGDVLGLDRGLRGGPTNSRTWARPCPRR